jgi:acyl carrier protein
MQLAHLLAHGSILGLDVNIIKWFEGRRLSLQGTEEYFRKAEAAKNPGPMVWRICGGRAVPWHQKSSNPYEEKIIISGTDPTEKGSHLSKKRIQPLTPTENDHPTKKQTAIKREDRSVMTKNTDHHQIMRQAVDRSEKGLACNPIYFFNQCQSALGQFIVMQQEQQKTAQYFINIQEKMLDAALNNHKPKSSGHSSTTLISLGSPPTPDIPDILFEPVDAAPSHVTPQSPDDDLPGTTSETAPLQDYAHVPVTVPVAVMAPAKTRAASAAVPGIEEFKTELIRIAAERTGFEPGMLSLESNMETDLGIDSIKKVEIFSMLRERYGIMNQLDEDQLIEEIADLVTLGSVIEWFDGKRKQLMEKLPEAVPEPRPIMSYSESAV